MTLNEFLDARIAEDEQIAKAAAAMTTGLPPSGGDWSVTEVAFEGIILWDPQPDPPGHTDARTEHIERHDPAQVLRQCAAVRAAVAAFRAASESDRRESVEEWLILRDQVMKPFAAIWSDHPDYDPQWGV
ncbi:MULTISPECIES: DUF6221 family protein [Actinomycetes]|uniref:DUF6221 family protein n=1 Tax=Micromonospora sp. NPDC005367 TaxID=3155590 RepID=UPI0033B169CA